MKEAYAVRRTVPPSAEIEARIEHMLSVGVGENPRESLSELAKLGARLIIQRAVEDEFDAWLGRARYDFRPRKLQTAEGELEIEIPQVRQAAETFASKLFPRTPKLVRTEPLKALVIGAFVRGLSMRDVESLCEEAGLGKLSKATASRMCEELKERFERFRRRDLYEIQLDRAVPRRDVHRCAAGRPQGGRAGRVGVHPRRRPSALIGEPGDA
jgi:putative transposase